MPSSFAALTYMHEYLKYLLPHLVGGWWEHAEPRVILLARANLQKHLREGAFKSQMQDNIRLDKRFFMRVQIEIRGQVEGEHCVPIFVL